MTPALSITELETELRETIPARLRAAIDAGLPEDVRAANARKAELIEALNDAKISDLRSRILEQQVAKAAMLETIPALTTAAKESLDRRNDAEASLRAAITFHQSTMATLNARQIGAQDHGHEAERLRNELMILMRAVVRDDTGTSANG